MTAADRWALDARIKDRNLTFSRMARFSHTCRGRQYDARGCAIEGSECPRPIHRLEIYIEYVGESAAFQSGARFHVECAEREGLIAPGLPCGAAVPARLRDQLAHYKACATPGCRERLEEWQRLRRMLGQRPATKAEA